MKLKVGLAAMLLAGSAQAADPVASGLPGGFSFAEYSGTAPVGGGFVDTNNVLFFIDEQTVAGLKSWYIFFDPETPQRITATITFDSPIVSVLDTKGALDSTNGTYGIDVDGDSVFNDYTTSFLIAPEAADATTWVVSGNTVTIAWGTSDPGDHIRVLVQAPAVPEPETWGLLAAGLAAVGWRARQRGAHTGTSA